MESAMTKEAEDLWTGLLVKHGRAMAARLDPDRLSIQTRRAAVLGFLEGFMCSTVMQMESENPGATDVLTPIASGAIHAAFKILKSELKERP